MLERDEYPAGVPCWIDTEQPDIEAATAFYGELFGWTFENRMPEGAPGRYLVAQLRGRDVGGITSPSAAGSTPAWNTYVSVDSADETAARVTAAGGSVLMEPFDVGDTGRMGVFADPSGAVFCAWQPGRHKGAQLVNEHGTWNFSNLNTDDPERAQAFYAAVFGWELSSEDGYDFAFWRVPGYGDFLEKRDPGVRERMADVGAPEGFEDAVAWLTRMTPDRFPEGTPAHWDITFAVDDADAIADRSGRLGGEVLLPPVDQPWVRMTVVRDPQGAVFTASQFVPPSPPS
jgi:uncharacterized protein